MSSNNSPLCNHKSNILGGINPKRLIEKFSEVQLMVLGDEKPLQADIFITCIWRQDGAGEGFCREVSLNASLSDGFDTKDWNGTQLQWEMNHCFNESTVVI